MEVWGPQGFLHTLPFKISSPMINAAAVWIIRFVRSAAAAEDDVDVIMLPAKDTRETAAEE